MTVYGLTRSIEGGDKTYLYSTLLLRTTLPKESGRRNIKKSLCLVDTSPPPFYKKTAALNSLGKRRGLERRRQEDRFDSSVCISKGWYILYKF